MALALLGPPAARAGVALAFLGPPAARAGVALAGDGVVMGSHPGGQAARATLA